MDLLFLWEFSPLAMPHDLCSAPLLAFSSGPCFYTTWINGYLQKNANKVKMDRLEALGSQLSKITVYDIKTAYNQVSHRLLLWLFEILRCLCYQIQAKNMVLNIPEMEAKVQEATNDDPWSVYSSIIANICMLISSPGELLQRLWVKSHRGEHLAGVVNAGIAHINFYILFSGPSTCAYP